MKKTIFILLLSLFAIPQLSWAYGYIQGFVTNDSEQPIEGAIIEADMVSATSIEGGYYIMPLPAGTYTMTASANGYDPQSIADVIVADSSTVDLNFTLSPADLKLEAVYPTLGPLDQDLNVTLTGTGFFETTRLSMYLDSGNMVKIIGSADTPGYAHDVTVVGSTAYVADESNGLQVININDPANPAIIGSVDTPGDAHGLTVVGSIAYVADGDSGLEVINISDQGHPAILGSVDTPGYASGVTVAGNIAYVADYTSGLQVINISDPEHPAIIGSVDTPGSARAVAVADSIAYVTDWDGGLQVINVSDPEHPAIIGSGDMPHFVEGVTVTGNTAYVSGGSFLQIVNVGDPENPAIIGSVNMPAFSSDVTVVGSTAYMVCGPAGLQVVSLEDPANPIIIGSIDTPGTAYGVAVVGSIAYVADHFAGLQVIDISEPANSIISSVATSGYANGVAVVDNIAYVADSNGGLYVIDISEPENPAIIGFLEKTPGYYPLKVTVVGSTAYVADSYFDDQLLLESGRLQAIDVTDPANPSIIGSVDTPDRASGITVVGSIAYVAEFTNGLRVIDVTDPANPSIIGSVDTPDYAWGVTVAGSTAYVADRLSGLQVIDISDPENPAIMGSVDTPGHAYGVNVVGSIAYVADGETGLQVINISDPENPAIMGSVDTPNSAWEVKVIDNTAYVADHSSGVQVIDVSDPEHPTIIGSVDTSDANDISIVGSIAYVADLAKGLTIVPIPVEITPMTITNNSEITATLPGQQVSGNYTLRVFNTSQYSELPGAVTFTDNPDLLTTKAIIVAGGGPNAPGEIWEETKAAANKAYDVLINQGYDHDSIMYLSMEFTNPYVDNPSLDIFLEDAITNWASDANELLLYFVDHGEPDNFILYANGSYTQNLTDTQLDAWLDTLQQTMTGPVTFIYDACQSGTFVSKLRPSANKHRYIITGASAEPAYFLEGGTLSFSYQFWDKILLQEGNLGSAFISANKFMSGYQTALLDANGNGTPNEAEDYSIAATSIIRRGKPRNISGPMIGTVSESQTLYGTTSATITASGVIDADSVWAQIIPPDINPDVSGIPITDLDSVELTDLDEDGVYEGTYDSFTVAGTYIIVVKAQASLEIYSYIAGATITQDVYSQPLITSILQTNGSENASPDSYETDDTSGQARVIVVNDPDPQPHSFHVVNDTDWIKFYGLSGNAYKIKADNLSIVTDVVIELYDTDGTSLISSENDTGEGEDESIDWTCPQDGIYYVKVISNNANFGENVKYDLSVYRPIGAGTGRIIGTVTNQFSEGVGGVLIKSNVDTTAITLPDGSYFMVMPAGSDFIITATAEGYETAENTGISVSNEGTTTLDFSMTEINTETTTTTTPTTSTTTTTTIQLTTTTTTTTTTTLPQDLCPDDSNKTDPGICGCNELDTDSDGDGTADCIDTDVDGDGIDNIKEIQCGSDPMDPNSKCVKFLPFLMLLLD